MLRFVAGRAASPLAGVALFERDAGFGEIDVLPGTWDRERLDANDLEVPYLPRSGMARESADLADGDVGRVVGRLGATVHPWRIAVDGDRVAPTPFRLLDQWAHLRA